MHKNTQTIKLPSGAKITVDDPDNKLTELFQKMFGNEKNGAVIVADVARRAKKRREMQ